MMKKAAIIIASGFEEGEALTIADIMRRANITCDLVGFEKEVEGGHEIVVRCDNILNEMLVDYDMVILPGGYGGAEAMKNNPTLISYLQQMNEKGKYVCAMCAAPIVLEKANLLVDKKFTAYQGYDQKIKQGTYLNDKVVIDGNIVTSRGPATAYAFAYKLVDLLGGDSLVVKKRMVYFNAFDVKEDE
ncbi:DJ-1 family glyoxalase III [Faecalibacillus intestinalis]|nr:DJ-1 family glyoxalase III [Faecalibacillus intestinalis]MCG4810557.1 DJ-1/PfpI family protein [Faecalibacillus intestinalis]